jgi:hypothetical protein
MARIPSRVWVVTKVLLFVGLMLLPQSISPGREVLSPNVAS